jgi:DNA-binding Lrp family transcriptional regulator
MGVAAYLLINTATGQEQKVVDALKAINSVKHAHVTTGLHDVICYAEGKDLNDIKSIIINDIRGIAGIQRTVTCFALDVSE